MMASFPSYLAKVRPSEPKTTGNQGHRGRGRNCYRSKCSTPGGVFIGVGGVAGGARRPPRRLPVRQPQAGDLEGGPGEGGADCDFVEADAVVLRLLAFR